MATLTKGADEKFCLECAAVIKAKAVVCPTCGCPQGEGGYRPPQASGGLQSKNKNTAGLLALLLGGVGVHKFYLDEPKWGLLYLFLCFTFVPAIMGVIEGISLFGMSGAEFDQRYNAG